jgi:hypothetical protein
MHINLLARTEIETKKHQIVFGTLMAVQPVDVADPLNCYTFIKAHRKCVVEACNVLERIEYITDFDDASMPRSIYFKIFIYNLHGLILPNINLY